MTVAQLVRHLQALGIESQDLPVTFVREDFPRLIGGSEIEIASVYGNHYHVEYYPEVSEEPNFKIVILREAR